MALNALHWLESILEISLKLHDWQNLNSQHTAYNIKGSVKKISKVKSKAIPVTGRGRSLGCETFRFPHSLESRQSDQRWR
jgi:hypothetical protein